MQHKLGLYIRVSTEEQALRNEGSLESQKHRLMAFVDMRNMQNPGWGMVVDSYVDELSAKDTRRPELQRLLSDMRRGRVNLILVTELSRLSRSIRDFCGLLDDMTKAKAKFLSIKEQFDTTTAAGEMMLFNMINLAQFERRQISERVSLNFHSRALRGLRNGGPAILGYEVDPTNKSRLVVSEREADEVRLIFNTFVEEGSSYRAAAKLRRLGITPKAPTKKRDGQDDSQWSTQTLQNMLRNYSYIGMREVNKVYKSQNPDDLKPHERYQMVKASWPAIIDEALFGMVQRMLDTNQAQERSRLEGAERRVFFLSGFSVCGQCGRSLVGSTGHGRVSLTRYYIHRPIEGKSVSCTVKCFRADDVEEAVINHLEVVVERAGYLDGIERTLVEQNGNTISLDEARRKKLERKIAKTEKDIRSMVRLQVESDGDSTLRTYYSTEVKKLILMKEADVRDLSQLGTQLLNAPDTRAQREVIHKNLSEVHAAWDKAPAPLKKRLLRAAFQRLVFHYDSIDIYYHTADGMDGVGQVDGNSAATTNLSKSHESSAALPAGFNVAEIKNPLDGFAYKAKVQGVYNTKIGSGGWKSAKSP